MHAADINQWFYIYSYPSRVYVLGIIFVACQHCLSFPILFQIFIICSLIDESSINSSNVCGIWDLWISVTFLRLPILGRFQPIYIFFIMSVLGQPWVNLDIEYQLSSKKWVNFVKKIWFYHTQPIKGGGWTGLISIILGKFYCWICFQGLLPRPLGPNLRFFSEIV